MKVRRSGKRPVQFFATQLAGEEPLTGATAERLYDLSAALMTLQPWNFVGDADLILVQNPAPVETCYCSVMGALGEVFSLHAYIGDESYRGLGKVLAGQTPAPGEFFATHRGVSVEFVRASELTTPDRELLKHFNHPLGRGMAGPIFRALRPGYHPWYVTEPEGLILARCMQAVVAFCETLMDDLDAPYWQEQDVYPMLAPAGADGPQQRFNIRQVRAPVPSYAPPVPPALNEAEAQARLIRILGRDYSVSGVLETGYVYSRAVIGADNQRKAIVPVAIVTEAEGGFLFKPELGTPGERAGETLLRAVFNAIEKRKHLPREMRVSQNDFKALLDPIAERLGVAVRVVNSLPEFDRAQKHLLAMMEGRGGRG